MFYYDDQNQLNLDIGMMQQFSRLQITAPLYRSDLQKAIKELEELIQAFDEKGSQDKDMKI